MVVLTNKFVVNHIQHSFCVYHIRRIPIYHVELDDLYVTNPYIIIDYDDIIDAYNNANITPKHCLNE